jgi:uncharacterized protein YciI
MDHKAWVKNGFDDGVFVLSGGQRPRVGGAIVALDKDRAAIEARVGRDPFVLSCAATAQIIEVVPSTVDDRVSLLRHAAARNDAAGPS